MIEQTTVTLAATTITKILVDLVRTMYPDKPPSWISPLLALLFGLVSAFLVTLATNDLTTIQQSAQTIISGIFAAGGAIGVTELQKRSQ